MSLTNSKKELRWGMIADDLTGACDAAAAFAAEGFVTRVVLELDAEAVTDATLTVVSTDSRDLAPEEAAARVADACRWMQGRGITVLFKKIDSVLRGKIEAEVEAVMYACAFESAELTPAFPAMGRTVRHGVLRVPRKKEDRGADLETMFLSRPEIMVHDAETDDDLEAIARVALASDPVPLLVGSGGLASAVARILGRRRSGADSVAPPRCSLPIWLVIGSRHASTTAQIECIEKAGLLNDPEKLALLRVPWPWFDEAGVRLAVEAVQRGMVGALVVSGGDTARLLCGALGAEAIRLGGEVLPGIPWGRLEGGLADGTPIVTKSGGFGEPDAMLRVVDSLKEKDKQ